jgi:hypothetical protein
MTEMLNAQEIWQSQPSEGMQMSAEAIRKRATKFERKIWRRNLRESVAAVVVIVAFSYFFVTAHDIPYRITWALFIAGMVWVIVQLYRKGKPKTMPADIGSSTCLEFFRSELERQRDLVKDVWTWYLAPMVPGYVALNVAWAVNRPSKLAVMALLDVCFVVLFIGVWQLNVWAARCLQRSIDQLPSAENPR